MINKCSINVKKQLNECKNNKIRNSIKNPNVSQFNLSKIKNTSLKNNVVMLPADKNRRSVITSKTDWNTMNIKFINKNDKNFIN